MFQEFRNLLALQCCKWHIAVLENFPADKYAMPTTYHACSNEVTFRSDWEIRCCCLFKRSNLHRRNPRPTSSACPPSSPSLKPSCSTSISFVVSLFNVLMHVLLQEAELLIFSSISCLKLYFNYMCPLHYSEKI